MILYFADRHFNILGQASTHLPHGVKVTEDLKTEEVEAGVAVFECTIHFDSKTRSRVEEWADTGNYILRSSDDETEVYNIVDVEIDTKKQQAYIYAEDDGLDLLNDVVGAYEADDYYPIAEYVKRFAYNAGWEVGINEVEGLVRKLSWTNEETASARLLSLAEAFDGCELSFSFEVNGLQITRKYINIYAKRGQDTGIQLRLNKEIDSITTIKSIMNLATALKATGSATEDSSEPITLLGHEYDDGDFYVDGELLKSRKALEKWSRYLWRDEVSEQLGGHVVKTFTYETASQAVLCEQAIAELKKLGDQEVNYEIDILKLPENVSIGDRVNIVDDKGELYLSSRVLILETSVSDQTRKATLGEHLIKKDGISAKVEKLAANFAKSTVSVQRAVAIAEAAKTAATDAKGKVDEAIKDVAEAQQAVKEVADVVNTAKQAADEAQQAASNAQGIVDNVEQMILGIEQTVINAQEAADNAYEAATTATNKAIEADVAAANAARDASEAKTAAGAAQSSATGAATNAYEAILTANTAKTQAEEASATAAAAKLDAEQAKQDVADFGTNLPTLVQTMTADYARKNELTETAASLQTQITQNAGQIASTATKVVEIDETANTAASQAQQAQSSAAAAQSKADQATADATKAQTAADEAKAAAQSAQSEADTAKAAAEAAQGVADKAKTDLEAAQADLATVQGRVDATEEDIEAAQEAVTAAQQAADKAQADAETATTQAANAQSVANTAATNAANAQSVANDAASQASLAQQIANEAKGNAEQAQTKANEAAQAAASAQATAATAKTNADNAQAAANQAVSDAAAAQQAANAAAAKAQQAETDLATAQQNLADVTSRVDATAEEVAAAQAAVATAQAAAELAKQNAATAQATADTAKENATAAQTAANNAKTAADNAQAAAAAAQAAANKAKADVEALAVRVTTAETSIKQNSDQIALRATKTEVVQYINDIDVGGRNLLPDTDFDGESKRYVRLEGGNTEGGFHFVPTKQIESGVEYTLSADIRGNANIVFYEINEGGNKANYWISRASLSQTDYKRFSKTFIVDENKIFKDVYICTQWGDDNTLVGDWFEIEPNSLKLEKGNKATDWTPAPEDMASKDEVTQTLGGYYTKEEADSAITVEADNVRLEVSEISTAVTEQGKTITEAKAAIEAFAKSLEMFVTDEASGTLMVQTSDGWSFDFKQIQETIEGSIGRIAEYDDRIKFSAYINDNGESEPSIEFSEDGTEFKVIITNRRVMFQENGDTTTYIFNNTLVTENINVKQEFRQGGWVQKIIDNCLCLVWEGATE